MATIDPANGEPVGRTAIYIEDADGDAVRVTATAPLPTSTLPPQPTQLYARASSTASGSGNSGSLDTTNAERIAVDISVSSFTGGTAPTIRFSLERQAASGQWFQVWQGAVINTATQQSVAVGPGADVPSVLTGAVRLVWTFGGTIQPTGVTFAAYVNGR